LSDGRKLRIYLDLDGVLCDFVSAAYRAHGREYHGEVLGWNFFEAWGMSATQFWNGIDAIGEPFWSGLSPYPWAGELHRLVAKYDPEYRVATSPSEHPSSAAGKVSWIHEHLPGVTGKRRHLTSSKAELAKAGRVLIDDSKANCAEWCAAGGRAILFPASHNGLLAPSGDVVAYVKSELQACRGAEMRKRQHRQRAVRKD
jgi:5'(3')-deoxyribonucleotidase